jgi:hypothetical protein
MLRPAGFHEPGVKEGKLYEFLPSLELPGARRLRTSTIRTHIGSFSTATVRVVRLCLKFSEIYRKEGPRKFSVFREYADPGTVKQRCRDMLKSGRP